MGCTLEPGLVEPADQLENDETRWLIVCALTSAVDSINSQGSGLS